MHLVLAVNVEVDQPWLAAATADFARAAGATVAVVCVDEVELERLAPVPRSVLTAKAAEVGQRPARRPGPVAATGPRDPAPAPDVLTPGRGTPDATSPSLQA